MNAEQRALGLKVLDHIEAHPDQHDQGTYGYRNECGTTACVAGWTIIFAQQQGLEIEWSDPLRDKGVLFTVRMPDGDCLDPFDAARTLLGLNAAAAQRLFLFTPTREAPARLRELLYAAPVPA